MLNDNELTHYIDQGFTGPFWLGDIADAVAEIEDSVLCTDGPYKRSRLESRHQDSKVVYRICTHPFIVDRVAVILGENINLWNSVFFNKLPGGFEIPWHQDQEFLLLQPVINVAAWIALDDVDSENGCLEIIPGSHKHDIPHLPRQHKQQFPARADIRFVDKKLAMPLVLSRGQFILMHPKLLHHSAANLSCRRRLGLVARYTVPGVQVFHEGLFSGHMLYCVRGEDNTGINLLGSPP